MADYAELLKFLNELGPQTTADPSEVALFLQGYREPCLNLLKYEVSDMIREILALFHALSDTMDAASKGVNPFHTD